MDDYAHHFRGQRTSLGRRAGARVEEGGGQNKGMNVTSICMRWLAVAPRGNYEEGP